MPFPNEHAARQRAPGDFVRIVQLWSDKGIRALGGPLKSNPRGPSVVQSFRFKKSKWTVAEAKRWLKSKDYRTSVEAATGESLSLAITMDDHMFDKDVVHTGNFVDPKSNQHFQVDEARMDQWAWAFDRMQKAGINVPIYHEHDRKSPLGNIVHMRRDGEDFMCFHQFADEECEKTALRAGYASIKTEPAYVDCEGNEYGEVISHIAVTAEPVITKQDKFERVLCLSRELEPKQGTDLMPDWLKKMLGLSEDATEDDVKAKVQEVTTVKKAEPTPAPVTPAQLAIVASRDDKAKEEALQLSRDAQEGVAVLAAERFQGLVNDGKMSAFRSKKLQEVLVGAEDGRNSLCLSRHDGKRPLVLSLLDVLAAEEQTVESGVKTGGQVPEGSMELSRQVTEDKQKEAKELLERTLNAK
jgi:hypothetical protein